MIDYFVAHLIGDFYLQSENLSDYKKQALSGVVVHCLLYATSFLGVFILRSVMTQVSIREVGMIILIVGIHALVDFLKWLFIDRRTLKHEEETQLVQELSKEWIMIPFRRMLVVTEGKDESVQRYSLSSNQKTIIFILDQAIHFLTIYIILKNSSINPSAFNYYGLVILSLIILMKPSNILIQLLIQSFDPKTMTNNAVEHQEGFLGAGERIGTLERLLMFIILFVTQGNFAGVAIVLTLKTIARYEKISEDGKFAEYFVIGSLTSLLLVTIVYVGLFQFMILNP